jgi:hypothetical protein
MSAIRRALPIVPTEHEPDCARRVYNVRTATPQDYFLLLTTPPLTGVLSHCCGRVKRHISLIPVPAPGGAAVVAQNLFASQTFLLQEISGISESPNNGDAR